jgi:hypothetical protein
MRRRLVKIVFLLLAGSVVNVAVAWGCVIRAMPASLSPGDIRAYYATLSSTKLTPKADDDLKQYGWKPRRVHSIYPLGLSVAERHTFGHRSITLMECAQIPDGVHPHCGNEVPDSQTIVIRVSSGFPMYALGGECWADYRAPHSSPSFGPFPELDAVSFRYIAILPRAHDFDIGGGKLRFVDTLPLRPTMLGFLVNTLFYAAILWLIFAAPWQFRRWRRARRGLCRRCGYDLRGHSSASERICPECGTIA